MLSVRVAAAVARALPRRAGLVSAGHRREEGGPVGAQRVVVERWLGSSFCKEGEGPWQAPPSCTAGCSGRAWPGRASGDRPLCSPSVRDGAEWCRGDGDLDALQRWGLRRISISCQRGALGEGQGLGASCRPPAPKRRGRGPLSLRDSLAEGQSELGKPDIV